MFRFFDSFLLDDLQPPVCFCYLLAHAFLRFYVLAEVLVVKLLNLQFLFLFFRNNNVQGVPIELLHKDFLSKLVFSHRFGNELLHCFLDSTIFWRQQLAQLLSQNTLNLGVATLNIGNVSFATIQKVVDQRGLLFFLQVLIVTIFVAHLYVSYHGIWFFEYFAIHFPIMPHFICHKRTFQIFQLFKQGLGHLNINLLGVNILKCAIDGPLIFHHQIHNCYSNRCTLIPFWNNQARRITLNCLFNEVEKSCCKINVLDVFTFVLLPVGDCVVLDGSYVLTIYLFWMLQFYLDGWVFDFNWIIDV